MINNKVIVFSDFLKNFDDSEKKYKAYQNQSN